MTSLVGLSALLFVACATATTLWCASMAAMGGMPMPGGWTMSMAWTSMPATSFLGMWAVMMTAMMLPSLVPVLQRYRRAVSRTGRAPLGTLTAIVGGSYFLVWAVLGVAAFGAGGAMAAAAMERPALARAVPMAVGLVVLVAGFFQLTRWKARYLASCRRAPTPGAALPADAATAWRHGLCLGLDCGRCCAGLMVTLLVVGVMDLRAMAVVGAIITAERLLPSGERVARAVGEVGVAAGLFLIARAAGLG